MKPLALAADAASYGVCIGLGCAVTALTKVVFVGMRFEVGVRRRLGQSAARANRGEKCLSMPILVLGHTSVRYAGAYLVSEMGERSGSINVIPRVDGRKQQLLRGQPLDDNHRPTTNGTRP